MTDAPRPEHRTAVLVTGATRGLGLESARRLAGLGHTVWLGARSTDDGKRAAEHIRASHAASDVRPVRLDVTDDASVAAALATVTDAGTGLDVLVNNAGIYTERPTLESTPEHFESLFAVNVWGPVRVTLAFLPLLREAEHPRLVMVSSGLGSLEKVGDPGRSQSRSPGVVYQASKAALNMITLCYRNALDDVRVAVVDPGYTATDLNGNAGFQTVAEGTDAIVAAAAAAEIPSWHFDRDDLPEAERSGPPV